MQKEIRLVNSATDELHELGLVLEGREYYYAAKRVLDVALASVLLILLSPMLAAIALAILIYSPGPVFFTQARVGSKRVHCSGQTRWNRVSFPCYKFRTMKIDADSSLHRQYVQALITNNQEQAAAIQGQETEVKKLINDPRIIRPGKILRKLSLDELPQLWNVLRGDMSMIGPRPAIPYEVEVYEPWHMRRLEAQPGISGLQQITARCTGSFDEQVRLDLEYIDNQSFWLDLKIAIETPLAIILHRGAG
jgi:lipopolysaccharide/colanic/teichoic acid biosynthesis glycosyltransferase